MSSALYVGVRTIRDTRSANFLNLLTNSIIQQILQLLALYSTFDASPVHGLLYRAKWRPHPARPGGYLLGADRVWCRVSGHSTWTPIPGDEMDLAQNLTFFPQDGFYYGSRVNMISPMFVALMLFNSAHLPLTHRQVRENRNTIKRSIWPRRRVRRHLCSGFGCRASIDAHSAE